LTYGKAFSAIGNYKIMARFIRNGLPQTKEEIQVLTGDVYKIERSEEPGMVVLAYQKGARGKWLVTKKIAEFLWNRSHD